MVVTTRQQRQSTSKSEGTISEKDGDSSDVRFSSSLWMTPRKNKDHSTTTRSRNDVVVSVVTVTPSPPPPPPPTRRKRRRMHRKLVPTTTIPSGNDTKSTTALLADNDNNTNIKVQQSSSSSPSQQPLKLLIQRRDLEELVPLDDNPFVDLNVSPEELRPSAVLTTGQCFHWQVVAHDDDDDNDDDNDDDDPATAIDAVQKSSSAWGTHNATEWVGVIRWGNLDSHEKPRCPSRDKQTEALSMVVSIRETPSTTLYRILSHDDEGDDTNYEQVLREYFQLDTCCLHDLYREWSGEEDNASSSSSSSSRMARIASCIPGVRMIEQDPWECLVSFLCSSNNNIPRITKMLQAIRRTYGRPLLTMPIRDNSGGSASTSTMLTLYSFPSLNELLKRATDADLRNVCGLGYRAKYLMETMKLLQDLGGESYLWNLRERKDRPQEVQDALIQFCGVGRKVADCVSLFSLRQVNAIPVDTHVWNIARRDYDTTGVLKDAKSITPTIYRTTGDLFRQRFPKFAGWAHSLLFIAELPSFRPILPQDLVDEMDRFRQEEKAKKQRSKGRRQPSSDAQQTRKQDKDKESYLE